ncbi:MAG: hypothetical protein ABJO88_18285 [Parasphingorhabdus sp.]
MDFLINAAGVSVMPATMFSFWKFTMRDEYALLRDSGQKLNLNMYNLRSGYRRSPDDPLRASHIKIGKIGLLHWISMPVSFLIVIILGALLIYTFE